VLIKKREEEPGMDLCMIRPSIADREKKHCTLNCNLC
jgi:hypothetical protein